MSFPIEHGDFFRSFYFAGLPEGRSLIGGRQDGDENQLWAWKQQRMGRDPSWFTMGFNHPEIRQPHWWFNHWKLKNGKWPSPIPSIKCAVSPLSLPHVAGSMFVGKMVGLDRCTHPMALWIQTLSEKVQITLQTIVNYTPVPLPFRRYSWIPSQLVGLRKKWQENPIFHGKIWLVSG